MFIDPIGTVSVSLPPGWAFDPMSSSLSDLVFLDWAAPLERQVFIKLRSSCTDAGASDSQWEAEVRSRLPQEIKRIERREGPWLVAERPGREGRPAQRWGIVRGPRFDVICEQTGLQMGGVLATPELEEAVRTLDIPSNRRLGRVRQQAEFSTAMQEARAVLNAGDARKAAWRLSEAREIARDMWLNSLNSGGLPEVPAAIAEAQAAFALAQVTGSAIFLQQAIVTSYRCRATLPEIPATSAPAQMRQVEQLLADVMQFHGHASGEPPPRNAFAACLMRSRLLLKEARQVLKSPQSKLSGPWGVLAVEEAMTAAALAGRGLVRKLSAEAVAFFVNRGITDPAEQVKAQNVLFEVTALDHLVAAGAIAAASRAQAALDSERGATANWLIAARRAAQLSPSAERDQGLVLALSTQAGALVALGDEPSLKDAGDLLEEAQQLLDKLGEDGTALRGQVCLNQAWLHHTQRKLDGSLPLVERALAAAQKSGDARLERAARSLRSQFLAIAGRHQEAVHEARQALGGTEDDAASTHRLNFAVALDKAGDRAGALEQIRAGLAAAAADEPVGSDVLRLLFVAAAWLDSVSAPRSLAISEAAESVLDAMRLRVGDAADRVGFDDAERHRQVAATLVQRRLDAGDILGALATADRHRARSLVRALTTPEKRSAPQRQAAPKAPPEPGATLDELASFITASARARLGDAGIPAPLDGPALADLVANHGRAAVLFHPNQDTLLCLLVRPEGPKIVIVPIRAPVSLPEILRLTEELRTQLGIVVAARCARGQNPSQTIEDLAAALADDDVVPADAELDRLRIELHDALFGPLLPLLTPGEPVVVIPYRELSVIPLAVLMKPDGLSLAARHPLSVLPSLASLTILQKQGDGPARAVVAGDPELEPGLALGPLPGAAAEAAHVAQSLTDAGLPTALLLGAQATESAVREKARGARVVHLACHAAVRQPVSSSPLFLAPSPPEDGLLLPAEVAELGLDGALVVLAACQSGLGRATADGVLGLGRAFMEAGARAVVLSLWRVDDAATAHLMRAFYDALRGNAKGTNGPLDVAGALRYAQLATRDAVSSHPGSWGAWLVVGDGSWRLA